MDLGKEQRCDLLHFLSLQHGCLQEGIHGGAFGVYQVEESRTALVGLNAFSFNERSFTTH
jgi:hypothetical protein